MQAVTFAVFAVVALLQFSAIPFSGAFVFREPSTDMYGTGDTELAKFEKSFRECCCLPHHQPCQPVTRPYIFCPMICHGDFEPAAGIEEASHLIAKRSVDNIASDKAASEYMFSKCCCLPHQPCHSSSGSNGFLCSMMCAAYRAVQHLNITVNRDSVGTAGIEEGGSRLIAKRSVGISADKAASEDSFRKCCCLPHQPCHSSSGSNGFLCSIICAAYPIAQALNITIKRDSVGSAGIEEAGRSIAKRSVGIFIAAKKRRCCCSSSESCHNVPIESLRCMGECWKRMLRKKLAEESSEETGPLSGCCCSPIEPCHRSSKFPSIVCSLFCLNVRKTVNTHPLDDVYEIPTVPIPIPNFPFTIPNFPMNLGIEGLKHSKVKQVAPGFENYFAPAQSDSLARFLAHKRSPAACCCHHPHKHLCEPRTTCDDCKPCHDHDVNKCRM